ncbi:MAG: EAL domain-containing protein [Sulfuricurvum sp.]|nr:EAL domain-containing protein [Sulfuricurvum sp.]MDD5386069.1 EAL domain-containing protein [Sulfuricurvum sp.]
MLLSDLVAYKNDCLCIEATLSDAIERMEYEQESHILLLDGSIVKGILTLKNIIELYASGVQRESQAIEFATYPIVSIHNNRPIDMAVEMMIDYEIRRIVLIDENEHYVGTLTHGDVLRYYESYIHTSNEIFQCLHRRNRAITVEYTATVEKAIRLMQYEHRDVLIVMRDNKAVGVITEKDILELVYQKIPSSELISTCIYAPIVSIGMDKKIYDAVELMREKNIHHLLVCGEDDLYLLNEKDLVLSYNTALEVKLEAKLRDARATYNLLGLSFCEIIDLDDTQIIKWLNAEAMLTFQVKIDDCVSQMLGSENWDHIMEAFRVHRGVEHEQIEINGRIYEVTLMEAEVNNQSILKLFLNDVSDLVRLSEELSLSLNHTIELEKEKSKLYLDVASVMFLVLDREGKVVLLNPKGCEILGVTKEEAIGKDWFNTFVVKEQASPSKELFIAIIDGQQEMVEYYENIVRTKSGEERIIAWHNALLRDQNGVITGTFSSGDDITRIQESEKELERMAHYDTLTNLPNRLLLSARLEHSLQRAQREKTKIVVLYVDIDNFKDINESYGYGVGDVIITQVASKMGALIRHEDTISRIGGDEFVILLEEIQAVSECERTLQQIMELFNTLIETPAGALKLSVSIGISLYPDDGENGETLLKHADIALRRAKEVGESNYCFFTQEMSVRLLERVLMERELRRAIEEKEFVVYYQPQVDLLTGAVIGAEALVRWQHPTLGIVRPDVFIPLAESNNLIIPIGEEVLAQSCQTVKRWKESGLFPGRISVNVSGKQFERPDAVETLYQIIIESTLEPEFVELEITESVLMSNPKVLGEKLIALKNLGIEIAIDDFGTGYSSLSYLKAFPIDKLKIDQSFVCELPHSDRDGAIVKAIIAMADALGFKTIAEGIEEEVQAKFLKEAGCLQGQGYLYSRPLDEKAFEAFLIMEHQRSKVLLGYTSLYEGRNL